VDLSFLRREWRFGGSPMMLLATLRYILAGVALWIALQYTDDPACLLMNACLLLLPWLLLAAATGRWDSSLGLAAFVAVLLYALGEYKYAYLGDRLATADFAILLRPANWIVVGQYPAVQAGLWIALGAALVLGLDAFLASRNGPQMQRTGRVVALIASLSLLAFCHAHRRDHRWEVFRDDADCGDMHICGVFSRLVFSTGVFEFEPPAYADPDYFVAQSSTPEGHLRPPMLRTTTRPDIVVWLNESTFDPRGWQLPGAQLPKLQMFEDSNRTVARGLLRVHTFGGKTWLSEFSMLTGLVPEDFGLGRNLVFETVPPRVNSSLVQLLKAQGYHTMALMPTPKRFYGAADTYTALGVDQVLTLRDFPEYDGLKGDEWDIAESPRLAEAALSLVQRFHANSPAHTPLFLYMLSIKEHAPYSKMQRARYNLDRAPVTETLSRKLTDYVERLRRLDFAVTALESTLARSANPTVFCWFGDHQPYFEEAQPRYAIEAPTPDLVTQYQITANFHVRHEPVGRMTDIAFLPSLLVDLAGVRRDNLFAAMSTMRRLCDGRLGDCPDARLVDSYHGHIYGPSVGLLR
jgi:hypothetical protein